MAVSNILTAVAGIFDTPEYSERIPEKVRTAIAQGNYGQSDYPQDVKNAVMSALVDKIAKQDIYGFEYNNFDGTEYEKGYLPFGGIIEDDFIEAMVADDVDTLPTDTQAAAGTYGINKFDPFNIKYPSVKPSYYFLKPFMRYHVTTTDEMMKRAFTSVAGASNFIQRIRSTLPESGRLDKYLLFREMLASDEIYGANSKQDCVVKGDNITAEESIAIVSKIRNMVAAFKWNTTKYNKLGVLTSTPTDELVLFMSEGIYNLLSSAQYNAYHKDLDFGCKVQLIDGFGSSASTSGQFAVLADKRAIKIYTWAEDRMDNIWNPAGAPGYWNTFYSFGKLIGYALHGNICQFRLTNGAA